LVTIPERVVRHVEGTDRPLALPGQAKGLAARGQYVQFGRGRHEPFCHFDAGVEEVFAVVEHQQPGQ
jgi:hypothetical protein